MNRCGYLALVLGGFALLHPQPSRAQILVLEAEADAGVRADLDDRANDNYGCDPLLKVAGSRGGGGIPYGGVDGARILLRFDVSALTAPVSLAVLEMTVSGFGLYGDPHLFQLDVHRIVDSGPRTPWVEGDGDESGGTPSGPGCTNVDAADGVAWIGGGDGGDGNNQTQPDFEAAFSARTYVDQADTQPGDIVRWNVTALVNTWVSGAAPNLGLVVRDVTSNGTFEPIVLTSREADTFFGYEDRQWDVVGPGPRLKIYDAVGVESSSWGRIKGGYR